MLSLERDWALLSENGCNMKQMLKYTIIVAYSLKSVSFSDLAKCVTHRHKRQLIGAFGFLTSIKQLPGLFFNFFFNMSFFRFYFKILVLNL